MFEVSDWSPILSHSVPFYNPDDLQRVSRKASIMGAGASAESKDIAGTKGVSDLEYSDGYSIPNLNRKATFQDFSGYPGYLGVYSGYIWLSLVVSSRVWDPTSPSSPGSTCGLGPKARKQKGPNKEANADSNIYNIYIYNIYYKLL